MKSLRLFCLFYIIRNTRLKLNKYRKNVKKYRLATETLSFNIFHLCHERDNFIIPIKADTWYTDQYHKLNVANIKIFVAGSAILRVKKLHLQIVIATYVV